MLHTLETNNFRKLIKGSFNFVEGLNAIRGLNEQGKTTLLEAFAYLIFGANALREPIDDVVTWGEKVSTLKVSGTLSINGTLYTAKRGKSGAEISVDGKPVCTGQGECTRFFSGLLGADPKVAANLMLANQAALRGALEEGPTATAQLIEKLSNFSLIDEVIALVQAKLPTGPTKVAEDRITLLTQQAKDGNPGLLDLTAPQADLASLQESLTKERTQLAEAKTELVPAAAAAAAGRQQAAILADRRAVVATNQAAAQRARDSLAGLRPVSSVTPAKLEALRAGAVAEQQRAQALTARRAVDAVAHPDQDWDDNRASFDAEVAETAEAIQARQRDLHARQLARQAAVAQRITEQTCAFCSKDLTDVPEVVARNAQADQQVRDLDLAIAAIQQDLAELKGTAAALQAITLADRALAQALRVAGPFYRVLDTAVPPRLEWIGPNLEAPVDIMAAQRLQQAEAEIRRADRDAGQKQALDAELARAEAATAAAKTEVDRLEPLVSKDRSSGLEADLLAKVRYHEGRIAEISSKVQIQEHSIRSAQAMHDMRVQAHGQIQANLAAASSELEDLNRNNALLRKLRGARPRVADKLWRVVLTTVSHYFSGIRGVQSVVSRDDSGFLVDGRSVPGLSGSTLDALGLAIRMALTKTFLPNNDFLVLDEPAAACDDGREANMLGVVTTANFRQVLLVTHSQLADAFAEQVINV